MVCLIQQQPGKQVVADILANRFFVQSGSPQASDADSPTVTSTSTKRSTSTLPASSSTNTSKASKAAKVAKAVSAEMQWCHQCHTQSVHIVRCEQRTTGKKNQGQCKKKFCASCFKHYPDQEYDVAVSSSSWKCFYCLGLCCCGKCRKGRTTDSAHETPVGSPVRILQVLHSSGLGGGGVGGGVGGGLVGGLGGGLCGGLGGGLSGGGVGGVGKSSVLGVSSISLNQLEQHMGAGGPQSSPTGSAGSGHRFFNRAESSPPHSSSSSSMNGEKGMWHGTIALTSGQEVASQIKDALQCVQNAQHFLHGGREIGFFDSLVEDSLQASRCASSDCACFAVFRCLSLYLLGGFQVAQGNTTTCNHVCTYSNARPPIIHLHSELERLIPWTLVGV